MQITLQTSDDVYWVQYTIQIINYSIFDIYKMRQPCILKPM